jgi:DNA-binding MarR family transcriptional regulator
LKTFKALRNLHEFRRRHLPFLETIQDAELVREIGLHQAEGDPLTLKALFLQGLGSVATIQRRLSRLKRLGVVQQQRADHDKRNVILTLSPSVQALYARMGRMLRKTLE